MKQDQDDRELRIISYQKDVEMGRPIQYFKDDEKIYSKRVHVKCFDIGLKFSLRD